MNRKSRILFTLLGCALAAFPAGAIPSIQPCPNGSVVYATGLLSYAQILSEYPGPLDVNSAIGSGQSRCYALWSSPLAYANAGCQTTAVDLFNGYYQYSCWKCAGASGPPRSVSWVNLQTSLEKAVAMRHGEPIRGELVEIAVNEQATRYVYNVDIQQSDGLIVRVTVDAETGEAVAPEPIDPTDQ